MDGFIQFSIICCLVIMVIQSSQLWAEAGFHHEAHEEHEEGRSVEKQASSSRPFFLFFFASIVHFMVHKKAQMIFKLRSQNGCIFQPDRVTTARACSRTVIPVSPQGKTGISLTRAHARKDEIPALRLAGMTHAGI